MSYNNNWVNELKESYLEEKKARQVVNEEYRRPKPQGKPVQVKPATGRVGKIAAGIAQRGREELTKEDKAIARGHMIKLYGKGTVTFESHSGGHFVEHESEGGDAHAHTFNPVTGKISKTPHVTSSYYGESVTILDQMHLGRGGTYDHVEHKGNSLQEEMALNEHLLMLIDVLCEELGIDVEDLLDLDEGVVRLARKAAGMAKRAERAKANFGPSDSAGHEVMDVLRDRATATNDQIDRKLSNSANRAKSRIVASGIGDKSTRSADAKLKAKTGKTIGGHAQSNLDKLRAAKEVLQGERGANFKPYSYDQQKEKVSLIRGR